MKRSKKITKTSLITTIIINKINNKNILVYKEMIP